MEELNVKIRKRDFIPYALDWKSPLYPVGSPYFADLFDG
jgi:hypothetical protein